MNKENNDKGITLTKMERNYLTELLRCRQCEFRSLGVKTDTIDCLIVKLDDHAKDFEDFEKAQNDKSDKRDWEMLYLKGIGNGKVEFANQSKIPDELKDILDRQNVSAEIANSIQKNMDLLKLQNLNCFK